MIAEYYRYTISYSNETSPDSSYLPNPLLNMFGAEELVYCLYLQELPLFSLE